MKRILIVNVNWRGDVLFSTPFIRALRKGYPQSNISCLIVRRCYEILTHNPHLNEIIIYEEESIHRNLSGKLKLISLLRKRNFDSVFLLHRSFTRRLLTFFAGIPHRVGYTTKKRGFLLTRRIRPPQRDIHRIDYFLNLAEAVGIKSDGRNYEFFISSDDEEYADRWLAKHRIGKEDFLVVINPGGNWALKRWPSENFAHLADALVERYGAKIVICGAGGDVPLAEAIVALMREEAVIGCGQTTLGQLGGIFKRANLVVSNDSGPMHIALAVRNVEDKDASTLSLPNSKVIALFGPTSPQITGPAGERRYVVLHKDIGCSIPCYNLNCSDNRCMKAITVEDVLKEAKPHF